MMSMVVMIRTAMELMIALIPPFSASMIFKTGLSWRHLQSFWVSLWFGAFISGSWKLSWPGRGLFGLRSSIKRIAIFLFPDSWQSRICILSARLLKSSEVITICSISIGTVNENSNTLTPFLMSSSNSSPTTLQKVTWKIWMPPKSKLMKKNKNRWVFTSNMRAQTKSGKKPKRLKTSQKTKMMMRTAKNPRHKI